MWLQQKKNVLPKRALPRWARRNKERKRYEWCEYHAAPKGFLIVRTGTLDKQNNIHPEDHIFTTQKLRWLSLPKEIPSFQEMYNRNEPWPKARD